MAKVLVIDDSQDISDLISETLDIHGFQVLTAGDGLVGVELAQRHLPDLVLCDVNMPQLDGYATLTALRQHASTATIPFIFLTGIADKGNIRQGMELGADDYLTKPFTIGELLATVKARLEKQAAITRQAERKLEELRGNISLALPHELLTPLTGILGFSLLLMENYDSVGPAELLEVSKSLHESALRLQRIIENFLLYSQIEIVAADPIKLALLRKGEFLFVKENIVEVVQQIAYRTGRCEDLTLQIESVPLPIAPDKLQKLVGELVDNALKFSRPGDGVAVTAFASGDRFNISITDHGRGMTPDQIMRIGAHMQFERKFFEQQGSGLGLAIAKRLTEIHGGTFNIDSVPDQQTTVQVSFPISVPSTEPNFML